MFTFVVLLEVEFGLNVRRVRVAGAMGCKDAFRVKGCCATSY